MPGHLLNAGSVVLCVHGGQAKPFVLNPRVKVMGQPVVTQGAPFVIAGCSNLLLPSNTGPCISALWVTASTRVKVMKQPVLLQDSRAVCVPNGTAVSIPVSQVRVKGI